jgi:O-antigen ligase
MEAAAIQQYIYDSGILLELVLIAAILVSLTKPQNLTVLLLGISLLRPNERFECYIPYPKVVSYILLIYILTRMSKVREIMTDRIFLPLSAYLLFIVLQSLLFHREYLFSNIMFMSAGLIIYLATALFAYDETSLKRIGYMIVFSCFVICAEPLYYHFSQAPESELWKRFHWDNRLQAWGMWANANETAFIACLGCASVLLLVLRYRTRQLYMIAAVALPMFAVVVILTGSRAGLFSLFLLLAPFSLRMSNLAKVFVVLSALGLLLATQSLAPERTDKEASKQERFDLRYEGVQLFKQNPITGIGFLLAARDVTGQPLHNTYVQAFAETGAIGGMLLVLYLIRVGKNISVFHRREGGAGIRTAEINVLFGWYLSTVFYLFWGNQLLSVLFFTIMSQIDNRLKLLQSETQELLTERNPELPESV